MTPSHQTAAGRAYLALQALARERSRPTDELMQLYALEGFLERLTRSRFTDLLVLKGGVLLAAFDSRRPTRDIDLAARALANDADAVLAVVREIASTPSGDGLLFDAEGARATVIRDDDLYAGVRVSLSGSLDRARVQCHVDVNVGDPIDPAPTPTQLPLLLGGHLTVSGYPLEMVLAEKIVTAVDRGIANTRWRDFVDIAALAGARPLDGARLHQSVQRVADHRRVSLDVLADVLAGYEQVAQQRWAAWRHRQRLEDRTPERFAELLASVVAFTDPVLDGTAAGRRWNPTTATWLPIE